MEYRYEMRLETVAISKTITFCLRGMACSLDGIIVNATGVEKILRNID